MKKIISTLILAIVLIFALVSISVCIKFDRKDTNQTSNSTETEETTIEEASIYEPVTLIETDVWGYPIDTDYRITLYMDYGIPVEVYDELIRLLSENDCDWYMPNAIAQIYE